jgi:hypothetical protein
MFTIYHIPEKQKIGITHRDPKVRVREQGYKDFEILETTDNYDYAVNREIELQKEYAYVVDKSKYDLARLSMWGKINGAINGKKNYKHGNGNNWKTYTKRKIPIELYNPNESYGTPKKPISVYDKQKKHIGDFESISKAAKFLNIRGGYITNVLSGRIKNTKLYDFVYA